MRRKKKKCSDEGDKGKRKKEKGSGGRNIKGHRSKGKSRKDKKIEGERREGKGHYLLSFLRPFLTFPYPVTCNPQQFPHFTSLVLPYLIYDVIPSRRLSFL